MSNPISKKSNYTQSRRNFLKGAAYTSALSVGGMSSLAFVMSGDTAITVDGTTGAPNADISVMQQQMLNKETVSLFNNSDDALMLHALRPVLIVQVNGSLVVKPNLVKSAAFCGMIMMQPRERISFDIQTTGSVFSSAEIQDVRNLNGQFLHISSEHSAFNKLIPVSSSDSVMA